MVNLTLNGDFSSTEGGGQPNPTSWTTSEPDSASSIWTLGGTLRFNRGNSTPTGSISQNVGDVPIGETIDFSFDYLEYGGASIEVAVLVQVVDSDGLLVVNETITTPGSYNYSFTSATNDYTVSFADVSEATNSRDAAIDNVVFDAPFVVCFADGTLIRTPSGDLPIETLKCGDLVNTFDNGPQPIRWHGSTKVNGRQTLAPIRFSRGAIGNDRPLTVSPQHRMLIKGSNANLMFGEAEVLACAKHLVNSSTIQQIPMQEIGYHHLLFDRHEVIWGNGVPSESFHPGKYSLNSLDTVCRNEVFDIFPELVEDAALYGSAARMMLKSWETRALMSQ